MQMHKADGGGIITLLVIGAIALFQWLAKNRSVETGGGDADADQSLPRSPEHQVPPPLPPIPPRHGHGTIPAEFQRRRETQPPRREPATASHTLSHPRAMRSPQPVSMPPTLTKRATLSPHSLRDQMAAEDEEKAAPIRNAGDSPGSLCTHMDEWMGQDLPEFKTTEMSVHVSPQPNTIAAAPLPPPVLHPTTAAARRAPRQLATLAMVASRGRHPYHLMLNPRTMRQAVVLTEVLGRPRGYDL